MKMKLCNFDILIRDNLLKLCKQKGVKEDTKAAKLDLQVALTAWEEVQRWPSTSGDDDDDIEERDALSEDEVMEDTVLGPELQGEPNTTPADAQDVARSNVSAMGPVPKEAGGEAGRDGGQTSAGRDEAESRRNEGRIRKIIGEKKS
ncbi:hypothetical protein NDU88_000518 [Pleurodeles waltl]|uniref:Uncharacterized protein n=1 Tax=Pleurodeles waltl TaxID=8319 RepID=A0AAV7WJ87_PLEWA|nr:hypothetical protein NDU88_000518 [Pleurodeles waltl]